MRADRRPRASEERRRAHRLLAPLSLLLIASLACSLPGLQALLGAPTPAPGDTPEALLATPTPLPPAPPTLVETDPARGEELAPLGTVRLTFDQPMDQASVEAATVLDPSVPGQLGWVDASTLQFQPTQPLERDRDYTLRVGAEARAATGISLGAPLEATFHTAGFLRVAQVSPAPDAADVSPATTLTVVFNRPVVPLQVGSDAPQPLSIEPLIQGTGAWVDSSIYVFRPEAPLPGGTTYTATVNPGLLDVAGGLLPEAYSWSFTTSLPRLLDVDPGPDSADVPITGPIRLSFNQPMDRDRTQTALSLLRDDGLAVSGGFEWSESGSILEFTPATQLAYNTSYTLRLASSARGSGGTPIQTPLDMDFHTVPRPSIVSTTPAGESQTSPANHLEIGFSAPMDLPSLLEALEITPRLEGLGTTWRPEDNTWIIFGDFQPRTAYSLTISQDARDPFGTPLDQPLSLDFSTTDLAPQLDFSRFSQVLTLTAGRGSQVEVVARNVSRLDLSLYRLSLQEFLDTLASGVLYRDPAPTGELLREWSQPVSPPANVSRTFPVSLQEDPLPSGVYMLLLDSPDESHGPVARLLVVRDVELVVKSTLDKAFVWAAHLDDGSPAANLTVQLLDASGDEIVRGATNSDGVVEFDGLVKDDPFVSQFATAGLPGATPFGLTGTAWDDGVQPFNFGIGLDPTPPSFKAYLYTDRPLYRPGQTVHFRGILRQTEEARYRLPALSNLSLQFLDARGDVIHTQTVPLSEFGTFNGDFPLSEEAPLGTYSIESDYGRVFFDVAAYRKPEFSVSLEASAGEIAQGDALTAKVHAEFLFGGPAAGADVDWVIWTDPYRPLDLPQAVDWFQLAAPNFAFPSFEPLADGTGVTNAKGEFEIEVPTALEDPDPVRLLIEATVTDEGGLQVTGRTAVALHPATVYLALTPERYALRAGETAVVDLESIDWKGGPVDGQSANVAVERVTWDQVVGDNGEITWRSSTSLVNQASVTTDADGRVRFSFKPERSGTFRVRASGRDPEGRESKAAVTLWVAGQEAGIWRQPAVGRLALVPDKLSYAPGETARILVPSPFERPVPALVTIERGGVLTYQVTELSGSGALVEIPLQAEYAPNVYVSVVLLRPASGAAPAAMAMGMVELGVSAEAYRLNLTVTPDRESAEPGQTLSYRVQATDNDGRPVRAEVSLALVDLSLLSLAEANTLPPFDSFYARQPLRVQTAASLALSGEINPGPQPGDGLGGGGGGPEATPEVRQNFPDTAFWSASVVTDENGAAQVEVTLPDNLTTWRMDARAVTTETQVGSASADVVVSKPLLIRPITPRFFTAGDRSLVAAIVQNNTSDSLPVEARLEAQGARIDTTPSATLTLPAGRQARIEWEIDVEDVSFVDLTFFVSGGGLQDASKATVSSAVDGAIPVRRYVAPDTAATSGILSEAGQRLEVVNLPRSFDATQGELRLAVDPSLGAAVESALQSLETSSHHSTEEIVSRFLPHLAALRAFEEQGFEDVALSEQVVLALNLNLQTLVHRQNADGGWGWWPDQASDSYITAYALFALTQARQAGVQVSDAVYEAAVESLQDSLMSASMLTDRSGRDRQALVLYALAAAGAGDAAATRDLAAQRENLSLWGRALLLQTLALVAPGDAATTTLLSDLQSNAIQSATGVHWQTDPPDLRNLTGAVTTTAQVLRALILLDRGNPIVADGVRWLLAARSPDGAWASSQESAWAVLALADWLRASGGLRANFPYSVNVNGQTLVSGQAAPDALFTSVELTKPLDELRPKEPNQILLERGPGEGSLYYSAHLTVYRAVEQAEATSRGLTVQRRVFRYDGACGADPQHACAPAESATVGDDLLVRVTLIVPSDQYYVVLEDPFPAGAEPIDVNLQTSPSGNLPPELGFLDTLRGAWGWSRFTRAELRDDRLVLFAEYLPAGTYQYIYLLHATFSGEFRVLPTRAWALYFPEVYGQGAGEVYVIEEGQ